jgi:hypothetical protein
VTDWLDTGSSPFNLAVTRAGSGWDIVVENNMDHALLSPKIVIGERFLGLPDIPSKGVLRTNLSNRAGTRLSDYVETWRPRMDEAINRHQSAFGEMRVTVPIDAQACAIAASFMPDLTATDPQRSFLTRDRLVVAPEMRQDQAILLVWDDQAQLAKPIQQFGPTLQTRRNLLRLAVPVTGPPM